MRKVWLSFALLAVLCSMTTLCPAADLWGLKPGTPVLKSAGQLAFGPDGILFIGDPLGAQVVAVSTGGYNNPPQKRREGGWKVDDLSQKLLELEGATAPVVVNDLAVNPKSGFIYLSLSLGEEQKPGIAFFDKCSAHAHWLKLNDIPFLAAKLPNPPEDKVVGEGPRARNRRPEAITDLAYVNGKLLVSGLTSEQAASKIHEFPFPFADRETGTPIEIYHGAHGRLEDNAVVRTFIPMTIDGTPSLLAGFTCTPLVRFPITSIESGEKVRGTTVAELGNRNMPIDLIAYETGGRNFLLMSNTARGVMKISTENLGRSDGITEPVKETAGQTYETVEPLAGLTHFDRVTERQIVGIFQQDGVTSLKVVDLP